jgi:hypothetical protein
MLAQAAEREIRETDVNHYSPGSFMRPLLVKMVCALAILLPAGYILFALLGPRGLAALGDKQLQIRELENR